MALFKKKIEEKEDEFDEYDDFDVDELMSMSKDSETVGEKIKEVPYYRETPEENVKKGRGKLFSVLVLVGIFVVLSAAVFSLFYFKVFDINTLSLANLKSKVPVLNNVHLPKTEEEEDLTKVDSTELAERVKELEAYIDEKNEKIKELEDKNDFYSKEVIRLQLYEDTQKTYKEDKEAFDKMIAEGSTKDFKEFYKNMSPENAEEIYRQTVGNDAATKEVKSYISTFQNMDDTSIASIFTVMVNTDLDLIVSILKQLPVEQRASVLSAMKAEDSAVIAKRMYPAN